MLYSYTKRARKRSGKSRILQKLGTKYLVCWICACPFTAWQWIFEIPSSHACVYCLPITYQLRVSSMAGCFNRQKPMIGQCVGIYWKRTSKFVRWLNCWAFKCMYRPWSAVLLWPQQSASLTPLVTKKSTNGSTPQYVQDRGDRCVFIHVLALPGKVHGQSVYPCKHSWASVTLHTPTTL